MNLKQNPFYILGVSIEDSKRKIMDVAEEKLLLMDEDTVENAKGTLLDSRKRLDAELAWFPGVDSEDNDLLISAIDNDFSNLGALDLTGGYDEVNFQLEVIRHRSFEKLKNPLAFGMAVLTLAQLFERFAERDFLALQWIINDNRQIAGFPEVTEEELLRHLDDRRTEIVSELKNVINELPPNYIISSMTFLASTATNNAKDRASLMIESLLDVYEIEIQPFVDKQSEKIYSIFDSILNNNLDKHTVEKNLSVWISKIIEYISLWDKVVKPIQIISLSKGTEHNVSYQMLSGIRGVCLTANNDFDMPKLSLDLLVKLNDNNVFEYMQSFHKTVKDDISVLRKIIRDQEEWEHQQKEEEKEYNEWAKSIYYETEWGFIFKDRLKVSVQGIEWNGCVTPLDTIVGMSWGAVKKSVNGIFTGTKCKIAFQTLNGKTEMSPNEEKYREIIEHLWRALAVPIFTKILKQLQGGETVTIGQIKIRDDGAYLLKTGYFSSDEKFFPWKKDLKVYSSDGVFFLAQKDGKYEASASYIYDMNTHILEFMIRQFFKNFNDNNPRLSSLLHGK